VLVGFNQALFLIRELGFSTAAGDMHQAVWSGVCYMTPLFGGWYVEPYAASFAGVPYAGQESDLMLQWSDG
jgi:hypothetical protein